MPHTFIGVEKGALKSISLPAPLFKGDYSILSITLAYQNVPWFRRACKLRANSVARLPFSLEIDGEDVSEGDEYQDVVRWSRALLYRTVMNVVKYRAAYHLLESNRFGLNMEPRFIPTGSVIINSNMTDGLVDFRVNGIGIVPLDRMVYVWEPSDESEIEPGSSDGEAALKAAGVLYAIEEMVNRYMGSGGVPVTAVKVPASVTQEDRQKLETWFQRMASGFRNAFKFLAVSEKTEFEQIGSNLKDTIATELTESQRANVAVAMGVPPSTLEGKSTDESNSRSEKIAFYTDTVLPDAEHLEPILNTQLYARLGLRLRFHPERLDVMQESQVNQANAVSQLTGGKPILSQRTAIEWIGLDPDEELKRIEEEKAKEPPPPPPPGFGASGAQPAPIEQAQVEPDADEEDQMKRWLKLSLAQHKGGSPATVGAPFDEQLKSASSGRMIRSVYEQHWPRPVAAPASDWRERAVEVLAAYTAAQGVNNGRDFHQ